MTPDWAATPIDVPYADSGNLQSLNLYKLCQEQPDNYPRSSFPSAAVSHLERHRAGAIKQASEALRIFENLNSPKASTLHAFRQ